MYSFVSGERTVDISGVLEDFKQIMGETSGTRLFTMDCCQPQIAAVQSVFPGTPIILCYFHFKQAVIRKVRLMSYS